MDGFLGYVLPAVMITAVLLLLWKSRGKERPLALERLPPGPSPTPLLGNFLQLRVKEPYKHYLESRGKERRLPLERLPPGPSPAPVLGNFLQLRVKEPYKHYLELSKKYGPVFTVWFANTPVVVISGYQALKDSMIVLGEEFSGRSTYPLLMKVTNGYGLLVSSGDRWKQLRRFSLTTLKNFGMGRRSIEDKVKEEASCLVQTFSTFGDSAFNPGGLISEAVCNVICSVMLGQRFKSGDPQLQLLIRAITTYFNVLNSPLGQAYNIFPRTVGLFPGRLHDMFAIMEEAKVSLKLEVEARMKTLDPSLPPQDFIEAFLIRMEEEKHNPNTEFHLSNLLSTLINLLSAGTETSSSTLRHSLLLMMKYPDIQARVQKEIDEVVGSDRCPSIDDRKNMPYTDAVIHEIQRTMDLSPTAVPHKTLCDTEFKSFLIPKGTMVLPLLSSVLFDPELWKNPDHFDPENFLDEEGRFKKSDAFVVFGMGKRACVGEALARVELFIFLTSLLQRFTFRATQPPEEIDITPAICSFGRLPRSYECYALRRA
ncbi:cytochrome P450 2M1-like isoform X1 [Colossoma macropomum]|uniref:cytochrome P450 2M1-like isoform X1 n=1 Tax=Colossoma macropomum TaxID=42526 RepID=UPI00186530ED|nr:cytochrome P450 2M1-like isoform X1 [Colossoma macropomum]XP_036418634.1 cytochrome P450 2M1-like isoform X1 [Colossoma macropomum]XP_036418641.1 cytochrome P450 2M1-like isoform X1 [Colossoma macropomum]